MNRDEDLYRGIKEFEEVAKSMVIMLHEDMRQEYMDKIVAARKKIGDALCRRNTGEEAAGYMSDFVNCMAMRKDEDEFVDTVVNGIHRTLNQSLIGLFIKVLIAEGACTRYDGRNEAAVKACKEMTPMLKEVYLPFI